MWYNFLYKNYIINIGYQIEYQLNKITVIFNKLSDKSIERVIKSLIEEKSLIRLLRILEEESIRTGNNEIGNRKRKIILKDISNRFYN